MRSRGNGKVEKANGDIKRLLIREFHANPTIDAKQPLPRVIAIKNRTQGPSGYSPYFLLYGTQPPSRQFANSVFSMYTRDPTEEETRFAQELVQNNEAPIARSHAAGLKASRDAIRSYTQGKKAQIRVYAPGDWVLCVPQRAHKHEPFYDRPWAIASFHPGNKYTLRSPGGIHFHGGTRYNGTNLFPAYVQDGLPVRSFWYASKKPLEEDRARLDKSCGTG
ncbi:hypothetical protein K3495_g6262 [Podosphaera aphanis]|nr:hypothetical protein K3495_g6262 [Podosphaera aphanis]